MGTAMTNKIVKMIKTETKVMDTDMTKNAITIAIPIMIGMRYEVGIKLITQIFPRDLRSATAFLRD